jgi:hypothetical protein
MTISKDFRFPVSAGEQVTRVTASDLEEIDVADGPGGHWSPEHPPVASAASCFAVTLVAVAKRYGIPIIPVTVSGTGARRASRRRPNGLRRHRAAGDPERLPASEVDDPGESGLHAPCRDGRSHSLSRLRSFPRRGSAAPPMTQARPKESVLANELTRL